jgi:hypothetical protein
MENEKKNRVWRQFCECVSEAVAYLPTTVSQLLLEALLFADLRGELNTHLAPQALECDGHCYKPSLLQAHWGRWHYTCLLWPVCLFTAHVGSVPSPLSNEAFLTQLLLQAFPLQVCWACAATLPSPARLFIYSSVRDCPSPSSALRVPCPLCYVSFCCLLFSLFFSLFSLCGVGLSRGLCCSGPGLSVGIPCAA